jgi:hypothetical protein
MLVLFLFAQVQFDITDGAGDTSAVKESVCVQEINQVSQGIFLVENNTIFFYCLHVQTPWK